MNCKSPLLVAAIFAAIAIVPRILAQQTPVVDRYGTESRQAAPTILAIKVFDSNLQELKRLRAGRVVRVVVTADVALIPNTVDAKLSASAMFTTSVFGRAVSYEAKLPSLDVAADSTINPAVGTKGFGTQKVGAEWQRKNVIRSFVLRLPKETPSGTISITASLTATGLKAVTQTFRLPVVR